MAGFHGRQHSAVGKYLFMTYHQIRRFMDHGGKHETIKIWMDQIVGIYKGDVVAGSKGQSHIAGMADATVVRMPDSDAGIRKGESVTQRTAAVGGTVVNEQNLEISVGRSGNTFHTRYQIMGYIVDRNNNADERIHGCLLKNEVTIQERAENRKLFPARFFINSLSYVRESVYSYVTVDIGVGIKTTGEA